MVALFERLNVCLIVSDEIERAKRKAIADQKRHLEETIALIKEVTQLVKSFFLLTGSPGLCK